MCRFYELKMFGGSYTSGGSRSRTRSIMMASAGMANDTNGMPSPTRPHSALEHKVRSELADEGVQV
jgi:hypothetical protein